MALASIDRVDAGAVLSRSEADALMEEVLAGRLATADIVRLLVAMNTRPPQVQELVGFAQAMRRHAVRPFGDGPIPERLVDTCGTGGKTFCTFNISTAARFVAAAAGARVAKHGNRGMSSRTGSADVLESLGVRVDISVQRHAEAIRELGIGFLFAQMAHASMRHAADARKQIGVRTVFNLLGPLTNPAGARFQLVGVPTPELVDVLASALAELGTEHALVVHGAGGLDEISLAGETVVAEVHTRTVRHFTLTPEDFGLHDAALETVGGGSPAQNAATIRSILEGETGARQDIVVMNSAAVLVLVGVAPDYRIGAKLAAEALKSGAAKAKLDEMVEFTK